MVLFDIGRACVKLAGREAGKIAVIVDFDKKNKNFVLIDGSVKRKLCNTKHLEPLDILLKIKKGASSSDVHAAMKKEKLEVIAKKGKEKKKAERPRRLKIIKNKNKPVKEAPKKVEKKKEKKKK